VPIPAGGSDVEWAPTYAQIAAYIPQRTLVANPGAIVDEEDTHAFTFTADTRPPRTAVDSLIADGTAWLLGATGTLDVTVEARATVAVAMWTAAQIELGWPDDAESYQHGKDLLAQAERWRTDVQAANEVITGVDPSESQPLPLWSFPCAPAWGDQLL
jgi:hypothetical protein